MKIAKFWAKEIGHADTRYGDTFRLVSWSGSNISVDDAKLKALEKIQRWRERLTNDDTLQDNYPYDLEGEIREELIEELLDTSGNLIGAITRNRYGALVLNAPDVMFIDVDLPPIRRQHRGLLTRLVGLFKARKVDTMEIDQRDLFIQKFQDFQQTNPDLSLRVYATTAGFRLVVLNQLVDPLSESTDTIFEKLGTDQLYRRLCKAQQCFRARLTPKPWRLGLKQPPHPFPRENPGHLQEFKRWLDTYQKKTSGLSVCNRLSDFGDSELDPKVSKILEVHDRYVLGTRNDKLF